MIASRFVPNFPKVMVPLAGLEPARCFHHLILSQARLPIPPQGPRPDHSGEGQGVNAHTIAVFAPIYQAPRGAKIGCAKGAHQEHGKPHDRHRRQHDPFPPVRGGGDRDCGGRRGGRAGRVVLPIRGRAETLPALPRAALRLLFRGAARGAGGDGRSVRRLAQGADRRARGVRRNARAPATRSVRPAICSTGCSRSTSCAATRRPGAFSGFRSPATTR